MASHMRPPRTMDNSLVVAANIPRPQDVKLRNDDARSSPPGAKKNNPRAIQKQAAGQAMVGMHGYVAAACSLANMSCPSTPWAKAPTLGVGEGAGR
eukprot:scaffold49982_cov36-Tisochrysis_lutea.AAC.4